MINGFVQFMEPFSGFGRQEVNKAMAEAANPQHHSGPGIGLKGSMIESDLTCPQFRGNEQMPIVQLQFNQPPAIPEQEYKANPC